jgi:hypothetical protein
MKTFKTGGMFKILGSSLAVLIFALSGQSALACTAGAWSSETGVSVGGPEGNPNTLARYSGFCAMQTPDSSGVWVEDTSPGPDGISRIRARFYVLVNNASEAVVYRGLGPTDNPVFGVRVNPNTGDVVFTSAGSDAVCEGCAVGGSWNSIEIDWDTGGSALSLWVNSDATTAPPDDSVSFASSQTVAAVRLGNLNNATGVMNFDSYESRRTTAIGRLLRGDADQNSAIGAGDITAIINEFLGNQVASGQPDCDGNGQIGAGDITCVIQIFLGNEQP